MNAAFRIQSIARWHVLFGLLFAILGMALGIFMSVSKDHGQHVTHAHALLLGFAVSVLYGLIYQVWLSAAAPLVAALQTGLHQFGTVLIVGGLFLLFSGSASESVLGPLLGVGSVAAISAAVLMCYQFARCGQARFAARSDILAPGRS